ncbi:anaerobic benzoate catabolism transcriptional regulator [Stieleria neptunia]|uniref:Anaerobic benzoate catabolism transcriptional regulator n=1 Tax=Stieleria neptunia TaxID=2527979 RepID=A0A518HSQ7_9BACT|nr:helix-turn-helix transcriptional regulator [Stieleria neptunia]QDV43893.1 anaerobic benzoate catabolism transcriptional regulator [Stieleria neptunia]
MAAKEILSKVGKRVRDLREAKGWSQEELGFQSGLHRNYIGGIERGERNLALLNLEKLAKALGVHARDLLP